MFRTLIWNLWPRRQQRWKKLLLASRSNIRKLTRKTLKYGAMCLCLSSLSFFLFSLYLSFFLLSFSTFLSISLSPLVSDKPATSLGCQTDVSDFSCRHQLLLFLLQFISDYIISPLSMIENRGLGHYHFLFAMTRQFSYFLPVTLHSLFIVRICKERLSVSLPRLMS